MNSYISCLKEIYESKFDLCKSNFKDCSCNNIEGKFLVTSTKDCLNYDLIKEKVFFGRKTICSVDSLAFDEIQKVILFIEFKDSKYKSCKKNAVESAQDSFLINRLIISLFGNDSMNCIPRKYVLVLDEIKNSTNLVNYYACKRSKKLCDNSMYKYLKEKLIDTDYFGNLLFNEIEISSNNNFDEIVENI